MATARQATLQRLAHLYKIVESARSSELRLAEAMVVETQQTINAQLAISYQAAATGRAALEHGDSLDWRSAEARVTLATRNCEKLKLVEAERKLVKDSAMESYRASRVESEQMDQLLEDSINAQTQIRERQTQAESDDRYLSRKLWTELQRRDRCSKHISEL